MSELTGLDAARQLADPINDVGGRWLLAPEVLGTAKDHGYPNGFVYYFLGRGGVLGDVDADVVSAAFGFFNPTLVRTMWELGLAVEPARDSARRYGAGCAEYGRNHLGDFEGAARFAELADRVVDAAPVLGLSLFAGWKAESQPADPVARAYFLCHVLHEWRGSAHVAAAACSGLTPLESILTKQGADRAKLFGWAEPYADVSHLESRRADCESVTDAMCAPTLEAAMTPSELNEFVEIVVAVRQRLDRSSS